MDLRRCGVSPPPPEGWAACFFAGPVYSRHDRTTFPVEEAFEVVGDIGETDLGLGPLDADGADEQAHPVFLGGEDMLDGRANLGTRGIGALALDWQRLAR